MATRIALLLFLPSLALSLIWLGARPDWRMLPAAAVGWYLADLLSGATHMYLDYRPCVSGVGLDRLFFYRGSRGSADYAALKKQIMARIGPFERLVFDFKVHHPQPAALGRRSFLYLARSPALFIALPLALALDAACWMGKVPGCRRGLPAVRRRPGAIFPWDPPPRGGPLGHPMVSRRPAQARPADDARGARAASCDLDPGFQHHQRLVQPPAQPRLSRPAKPGDDFPGGTGADLTGGLYRVAA